MAHFTLVRNPVTNWTSLSTITVAEMNSLTDNLSSAINGDAGGTWATASTPWSFGAAGVTVTGPTVVRSVGSYAGTITSLSGARWNVQAGYPLLGTAHSGRTRSIVTSTLGYSAPRVISGAGVAMTPNAPLGCAQFAYANSPQQIANAANTRSAYDLSLFYSADMTGPNLPVMCMIPLQMHGGDASTGHTITSIVLSYQVGVPHAMQPVQFPKVRVLRCPAQKLFASPPEYPVPMTSEAAGADANGFVPFVTGSPGPSAWYAAGALQTVSIPIDQYNVVDTYNYSYVVHVVEEVLPSAMFVADVDIIQPPGSTSVAYPPTGLSPLAYATPVAGQRVLLASQADTTQNGVWIASSNAWTRASDTFRIGTVVLVNSNGGTYANTLWACITDPSVTGSAQFGIIGMMLGFGIVTSSLSASVYAPMADSAGNGPLVYAGMQGTVLRSIKTTFSGIADTRAAYVG